MTLCYTYRSMSLSVIIREAFSPSRWQLTEVSQLDIMYRALMVFILSPLLSRLRELCRRRGVEKIVRTLD